MTKVTTTDALLGITISDGTTKTTYTPANNPSTAAEPIVLPKEKPSFTDIGMLVPTTANSIALSALIGAPYNYWGDDDGDGQGVNGITASGNLSVSITDKVNNQVSRNAVLSICNAPYKVTLSATDGSLTTQYGVPNSSSFSGSATTYYISPKATPTICYARPTLNNGTGAWGGPADIWSPGKGFLPQSTESSSYSRNFPTTGANNLLFDLLVGGIDAATLTWPTVTKGGITATMTLKPPKDSCDRAALCVNPDGASSVRVTLTGPAATEAQQKSKSPGNVATPTLPQTFELVGYDSNNKAVIKYGFVLKQWFVNRGTKQDSALNTSSWCSNLGGGYRLPPVKDLTNATGGSWTGGTPPSTTGNYYNRNIGAGLFAEWGSMNYYTAAGFVYDRFWTGDSNGSNQFSVNSYNGDVYSVRPSNSYNGVCAYP